MGTHGAVRQAQWWGYHGREVHLRKEVSEIDNWVVVSSKAHKGVIGVVSSSDSSGIAVNRRGSNKDTSSTRASLSDSVRDCP